MSNLFITFEMGGKFFILIIIFFLVLLPSPLYLNKVSVKLMKANFLALLSKSKSLSSKSLFLIFFLLAYFNVMSLWSYIFTVASQISFSMSIAWMFWLTAVIFQISFFKKDFVKHLVPMNTPLALISFLVLIELTSILIRPITLSARLSANLTAGHLILGLLSGMSVVSWINQSILFLLESLVSVVQAYVFSLLFLLYFNE